ncbi:hypothetical protein AQUCO_03100033v1 [Aquilegia coerulea]|uniref:HAT C-terminal dimerisation domain-containing protein n=1 Tax=Aquilegia coerulea TaxID=218851 RepID=A0A2G5D0H3_AQUCA|nr:hypothetical protein AQUCO_03100033v1 [Aquilegia coerulea]
MGASSDNGTNHLKKHLNTCPKMKNKDVRQQLIVANKNISDGIHANKAFKFDQMQSRLDLARMIIKHEYPFTMVDHEYFRVFINNLQPLFNLEEREKLYKFFDEFSGRVSFTTDLWTFETQDAYFCLTAHFIDNDWGTHSGDEISKVVMACLLDWNLDKKVGTISVNNASSNDVMVNKIKDILNGDGLLVLGGQLLLVRCTTHILNLIVKDNLSVIGNVLYIRESCKFVKATPQRKLKWKSVIEQVKVSSTQQICLDVPTTVAVVLNPRFKMRFVQYYFNLIYGLHEAEIYINKVQISLEDLYNEYDSKFNLNSGTSHSPSSLNLSGESLNMDKIKKFETWCIEEGYESVTKKSKLEQYLVEPIFPVDCALSILNWWKLNTPKYPCLSKLARDGFTIPVSIVASEPALSTSGRVLNEYHSSLTPDTLQGLTCAQNWLKSSKVDLSTSYSTIQTVPTDIHVLD